ncbi:hypothetical protein V6Z12_A04G036500 [Gossypium hirsutum]
MAVSLLSHELSDLCLGKPALRSLSITSTIAEALEVLKTSDDNFVSIWNCDDDECCSRCVGKVCIVDVICYLCKDENFVSPSIALKQPVSVLLPKIPGLIIHVEPSCSLLEAIDLILEGAQNLVVPIKTRVFNNKRSKQQQKPFCWLTQEDIIRFLLSFIGLFSPISSFSIDTLNIISPNTLTIEYHSPASAAIGAISRALVEQTSVAVVDSERILIEELVKVVSAKLKEKNMNGMLQHFTVSMSCGGFSSSSSSDEEYSSSSMAVQVSPFSRPGRISRSMSYSARMVRRSEAIVCHPKSSLVAVMIQAIAHRVNYVWVIEEDCSLVGIVTFSDMLKVVRESFETMA